MLETVVRFYFLAFSSQASLQTSNFQVDNRTTGAAVSLIKKSDVKNHLSPRHRTQIHLCPPESQPDATGFSAVESGTDQPDASDSAKDLDAERSSSGSALAQDSPLIGSMGPQTPAKSKSVQP
jgi:hypothetical protein